jgi:hypothetical protein
MATIDSALDEIMKLDFDSREMLLDILAKRQIEARREEIANNAKKTYEDYKFGNLEPLSAEQVIGKLGQL